MFNMKRRASEPLPAAMLGSKKSSVAKKSKENIVPDVADIQLEDEEEALSLFR